MRYISTRGGMPPKTFTEILLSGLAPDGGLAVQNLSRASPAEMEAWRHLDIKRLHFKYFRVSWKISLLTICTRSSRIIQRKHLAADITRLKRLSLVSYLCLSNGPTLAFQDIAMQLLGNLFEYTLAKTNDELNILGATSGDTGSSAEYAMRGKRGIRVFMLSPLGKMSRFQTAQMFSLLDDNIFNIAIRGVFDDCQDIVKAVSNDRDFKQQYQIGTVNSINWARIAAQIVYYFKGYFAVTQSNVSGYNFCTIREFWQYLCGPCRPYDATPDQASDFGYQ